MTTSISLKIYNNEYYCQVFFTDYEQKIPNFITLNIPELDLNLTIFKSISFTYKNLENIKSIVTEIWGSAFIRNYHYLLCHHSIFWDWEIRDLTQFYELKLRFGYFVGERKDICSGYQADTPAICVIKPFKTAKMFLSKITVFDPRSLWPKAALNHLRPI